MEDLLDRADARLEELTDRIFALVVGIFEELGDLPAMSVTSRVVAASSLIHGYVLLRIDGNFEAFADEKSGLPRHLAILEPLI